MLVQIVRFKSTMSDEDVLKAARDRMDAYRAVPGLVQKYYVESGEPGGYGGVLIWESVEALAAFRETDLAKTIAEVYGAAGGLKVDLLPALFPLRTTEAATAAAEAAI